MKCVTCGQPIEQGRREDQQPRLAKYSLKCRVERRRRAGVKYTWRPEYDARPKAHYFGGINRRFQVLTRMIRLTGLPCCYIKRSAACLGLSMPLDCEAWTRRDMDHLVKLVSPASAATIAKRLNRPESSFVTRLKRVGMSRRVRDDYTTRELELSFGDGHHKIAGWIPRGWLQDRHQTTRRPEGNGNDIHRIHEEDLLNFIRNDPREINLSKVDQTWFLDLLLLPGHEVPKTQLAHDPDREESDAAA